jgi:hypothetical protein
LRLLLAPELLFTQQSYAVMEPSGVIDTGDIQLFMISLPIGVEYDFPIRQVPGLSLYPQLLFGFNASVTSTTGSVTLAGDMPTNTSYNGMVSAAFGLRYVWRRRLDVSFEPFGIAIYGPNPSTLILYRTMASIGVTF